MASHDGQLHFALFPLMSPGHMNPMVDIARLLAQHGITVSIVTTPINAARFAKVLARSKESGLQIQIIEFQFPSVKAGLPEGCENFDMLPSLDMAVNLFTAASMLEQPVESFFEKMTPPPSCIISDVCLPWTSNIARKHQIPRISFSGTSCFCMLCVVKVMISKVLEGVTSEKEYFVVPGIPGNIEFTKSQLPRPVNLEEFNERVKVAEMNSYGLIMNTFEELEPEYVEEYRKASGGKVWCIGPVSLCNNSNLDRTERGNNASINESECLNWLDSWEPGSVVYVCLGSISNLILLQLIELGLGLEEANKPFIWVVNGGEKSKELEKWICESGFEERTKGRGLVIRGWAPQVLLLSHPAIGGFLTHCGWNSTLEAICAGVPMATWPLFADQFCNEKLVVQVLKIGVRVGADVPVTWGEEEQIGVLVKKEDVIGAVDMLMNEGDEREERRKRAKQLAEMAKRAMEKGGSSYIKLEQLVQDVKQKISHEKPT